VRAQVRGQVKGRWSFEELPENVRLPTDDTLYSAFMFPSVPHYQDRIPDRGCGQGEGHAYQWNSDNAGDYLWCSDIAVSGATYAAELWARGSRTKSFDFD